MRVFAEVATSQYVTEVSNIYGSTIQEQVVTEDKGLAEYL
jgi:hypothetical protein